MRVEGWFSFKWTGGYWAGMGMGMDHHGWVNIRKDPITHDTRKGRHGYGFIAEEAI